MNKKFVSVILHVNEWSRSFEWFFFSWDGNMVIKRALTARQTVTKDDVTSWISGNSRVCGEGGAFSSMNWCTPFSLAVGETRCCTDHLITIIISLLCVHKLKDTEVKHTWTCLISMQIVRVYTDSNARYQLLAGWRLGRLKNKTKQNQTPVTWPFTALQTVIWLLRCSELYLHK